MININTYLLHTLRTKKIISFCSIGESSLILLKQKKRDYGTQIMQTISSLLKKKPHSRGEVGGWSHN